MFLTEVTFFIAAVIGCADNLAHIALRYMLSVCVEKNEQGKGTQKFGYLVSKYQIKSVKHNYSNGLRCAYVPTKTYTNLWPYTLP